MAATRFLSRLSPLARGGTDTDINILIIGAGFSGLGMAIRLRQAGIDDITILERGAEVGGTWRDNHYPGAACDVASHLYSFSFEPNPNWSRAFGQQPEILTYIKRLAAKYDLYRCVRFNTAVQAARFDETAGVWRVCTDAHNELTARVLISAAGALSNPAYPAIEGLDQFAGKLMHTADWDDEYRLAGQRVAVIGSGASAIQAVPEIQKTASRMTVFQRTPSWIMPKPDRAITSKEQARYRASSLRLAARRQRIYWVNELFAPLIISDRPLLKKTAQYMARRHIKKQIADPALRARVTPDYAIGCKRILISNDWYPAIQADNAELISDGPARITANSVITKSGRKIEVDAIVCATGFKVPTKASAMSIKGLNGLDLNAAWAEGAEAYKGVAVAGFPNLFFLMGPNTGPSHTSVLAFTEMQMAYIAKAVVHLARHDLKWLTVKKSVQDRFNRGIQKRMRHTAWTSGCTSWYLTDSGKNTTLYPGFNWEYRMRLWRFRPGDYEAVPARCEPADNRAVA